MEFQVALLGAAWCALLVGTKFSHARRSMFLGPSHCSVKVSLPFGVVEDHGRLYVVGSLFPEAITCEVNRWLGWGAEFGLECGVRVVTRSMGRSAASGLAC